MKIKLFTFFLIVVLIAAFSGCMEPQKSPVNNLTPSVPETGVATPTLSVTEQKIPAYNESKQFKQLKINDTFVTWSRGYYSNTSYKHTYFRVITRYSEWNDFLDEQGYFAWLNERGPMRLEGTLFPGLNVMPKTITSTDFNNYFIIAAMMGLRGHAESDEIKITNISRINNTVKVTVHMFKSSAGAAVMSEPYHIVIVKRELLPVRNATFNFIDTEGKLLGRVEIKPV